MTTRIEGSTRWARKGSKIIRAMKYERSREGVIDAVTDLLHWARYKGWSLDAIVRIATTHVNDECARVETEREEAQQP